MRTSQTQFELMVEFMERYGDLNKPTEGPQGRLRATRLWTELTTALNLDVTGDSKPMDKWKKVWSDFKNNTKRKAAKIYQSAMGTGGGPACRLVLTDLEQRVLNIIEPQSATGLAVAEAGIEIQQAGPSTESVPSTSSVVEEVSSQPSTSFSDIQIILPPRLSTPTPAPSASVQDRNITSVSPGSVERERSPRPQVIRRRSAPRQTTPRRITPRQLTTPRRITPRRTVPRRTPRRAATSSQADAAAMRFEEQDQHWRRIFQHVATQHFQLRERELEQQAVWQNLVTQCVALLQQYLNK